MAYNNYQQVPFWDFIRSFDQNGAGVDHAAEPHHHPFSGPPGPPPPPHHASGSHPPPPPPPGAPGAFPWGGPGFGGPGFWGHGGRGGFDFGMGGPGGRRGGRRGRHCHRERDSGEERSRSRTASPSGPEGENREGHVHEGPRGPRRHGRGGHGHRGGWGGHGRRGPPPFGGPGGPGGFDLSGLFAALNNSPVSQHPWAQYLRQYAEQAGHGGEGQRSGETLVPEDTENNFVPPIDVFSTETAYILHIALPGAKKEDVGVNWDSDKGELNVAGVVYRQGDEEFLKTLSSGERKVGVFERSVKLPPGTEEKEEVDGEGITAKLEDGVLMVTVPKVEKEWTDVKRVDIE